MKGDDRAHLLELKAQAMKIEKAEHVVQQELQSDQLALQGITSPNPSPKPQLRLLILSSTRASVGWHPQA